jgi:hypothetical protein
MAADRSANFVIKAKDAATGPLGKVGGAMGKLKSAAGTAFKAIGAAAIVATAAIAGFVAQSIKGAIEDERSTILTNAALKARGFALDELGPKIEEQIKAAQRFGIADDKVRAGLEVGSRFFKSQTKLIKANELAMTISAVTGQDVASVMAAIGKAANGSTRGLAAMIGPIEEGATLSDLYAQGMGKFQAVAEELANSTSGRFAAAQETFNEQMDAFGAQFLPLVSEGLTFLTEKALPAFQGLLDTVGPVISDIVDNYVRPLVDSVGQLFSLFEKSDFNPFILALDAVKLVLDGIRIVIDAIVAGLKFIGIGGGNTAAKNLETAAANAGYGGGSYINPMNAGGGTNTTLTTSTNLYLDGRIVAQSVNKYLGPTLRAGGPNRTGGR